MTTIICCLFAYIMFGIALSIYGDYRDDQMTSKLSDPETYRKIKRGELRLGDDGGLVPYVTFTQLVQQIGNPVEIAPPNTKPNVVVEVDFKTRKKVS